MVQSKICWKDESAESSSNTSNLISVITTCLLSGSVEGIRIPLFFTRRDECWKYHQSNLIRLPDCNHEEADTKLIFHALREDTDCVVVARDTDVLVLMVYAYAKHRIRRNWYMKYSAGKYANIGKIVQYLGNTVALKLPFIHCITGCDTTSYLYGVGKTKVLNKCLRQPKVLSLLSSLGVSSGEPTRYQDIVKFIQTVMYSGHIGESLVETRVRLYEKQKVKSSLTLPPDPDSMKQIIMRVNHQLYYWRNCDISLLEAIPLHGNGWTVDVDNDGNRRVVPVGHNGHNLVKTWQIVHPLLIKKFPTPSFYLKISKYFLTVTYTPYHSCWC